MLYNIINIININNQKIATYALIGEICGIMIYDILYIVDN